MTANELLRECRDALDEIPGFRLAVDTSLCARIDAYLAAASEPEAVVLTDSQVDAHLDAILRASGSALRHYSMPSVRDAMRHAVRAIERAIVPPGYVLVPSEPTRKMLEAVDSMADDKYVARGRAMDAWDRMLAARPKEE